MVGATPLSGVLRGPWGGGAGRSTYGSGQNGACMAVSSTERLAAEPWSTGSFLRPWVLWRRRDRRFRRRSVLVRLRPLQRDRHHASSASRSSSRSSSTGSRSSYVLCGLVAWSRRPASRFGPLMIAAGFANFLSTLSWTTNDVSFTIGQALDFVPPVLFLHVFLAFPTGRLEAARAGDRRGRLRGGDRARARSHGVRRLRAAQPARGHANPDVGLWALRVQLVP